MWRVGFQQCKNAVNMGNVIDCCCKDSTDESKSLLTAKVADDDDFTRKYAIGKDLGKGGFAVVKEVTQRNDITHKYAVKIVPKDRLKTEQAQLSLIREVEIMRSLNHPHIVRCYEMFEDNESYKIILELCTGGELFDRIESKKHYNEKEARDVIYILVDTVHFLHSRNIVHRDLKPKNLLMASKSDDLNIKIADFGFAAHVPQGGLTDACGTPEFVPPEVLLRIPYGVEADMWSIGVIAYILLAGYSPFYDKDYKKLYANICTCNYTFHPNHWDHISEEAKSLVTGLLKTDRSKRLTAMGVLKHPWMKTEAHVLSQINLDQNLEQFKKYNARRRWLKAANAVIAMNIFMQLADSRRNANHSPSPSLQQPLHSTVVLPSNSTLTSNSSSSIASVAIDNDSSSQIHLSDATPVN